MTTERQLLDALHTRLAVTTNGDTHRYVLAEHVRYDPGAGANTRIADALAVDCWRSGGYALIGYEVKTTRSDWLRELADPSKAETWAQHCHEWWVVTGQGVVQGDLPDGWGHLVLRDDGKLARRVPAGPRLLAPPLPPMALAGLVRATAQTAHRRASTTPTTPATASSPRMDGYGAAQQQGDPLPPHPVAALAFGSGPDLPTYDATTCPVWDCTRTHAHTHPERTR